MNAARLFSINKPLKPKQQVQLNFTSNDAQQILATTNLNFKLVAVQPELAKDIIMRTNQQQRKVLKSDPRETFLSNVKQQTINKSADELQQSTDDSKRGHSPQGRRVDPKFKYGVILDD